MSFRRVRAYRSLSSSRSARRSIAWRRSRAASASGPWPIAWVPRRTAARGRPRGTAHCGPRRAAGRTCLGRTCPASQLLAEGIFPWGSRRRRGCGRYGQVEARFSGFELSKRLRATRSVVRGGVGPLGAGAAKQPAIAACPQGVHAAGRRGAVHSPPPGRAQWQLHAELVVTGQGRGPPGGGPSLCPVHERRGARPKWVAGLADAAVAGVVGGGEPG
jgi:hypothetical protein